MVNYVRTYRKDAAIRTSTVVNMNGTQWMRRLNQWSTDDKIMHKFTHFAWRTRANIPAANGALADVPVCISVQPLRRSVVTCTHHIVTITCTVHLCTRDTYRPACERDGRQIWSIRCIPMQHQPIIGRDKCNVFYSTENSGPTKKLIRPGTLPKKVGPISAGTAGGQIVRFVTWLSIGVGVARNV